VKSAIDKEAWRRDVIVEKRWQKYTKKALKTSDHLRKEINFESNHRREL